MNESLLVWGFGSFFRGATDPGDIDLLLLHEKTAPASCMFAIACKAQLQRLLPDAHVVMLSKAEADGNDFIGRSHARLIGRIDEGKVHEQVSLLVASLIQAHG